MTECSQPSIGWALIRICWSCLWLTVLQYITNAELLAGKGIAMPPLHQVSTMFKKAPKAKATGKALPLPLG